MQRPQHDAADRVNQSVDLADLAFDARYDIRQRVGIEHVRGHRVRGRAELPRRRREAFRIACDEHDAVAACDEAPRHVRTDATGSAGDEYELTHAPYDAARVAYGAAASRARTVVARRRVRASSIVPSRRTTISNTRSVRRA